MPHHTIDELFRDYLEKCHGAHVPPAATDLLEQAFFAGFGLCLLRINQAAGGTPDSLAESFNQWKMEMMEKAASVIENSRRKRC